MLRIELRLCRLVGGCYQARNVVVVFCLMFFVWFGGLRVWGQDGGGGVEVRNDKVFLCIYADHLRESAEAWVAYREMTGWDSEAVAISSIIGNDVALALGRERERRDALREAFDKALAISKKGDGALKFDSTVISPVMNKEAKILQTYIRKRFTEAKAEKGVKGGYFAVMLLGDVNGPKDHLGDRYVIPTYHYVKPIDSELRLDWFEPNDYATDGPYQLADDRDELPDYLLGRVPAQTNGEAEILLKRIKDYESGAGPGDWRRRINYIASEGGFGAIDKILEKMFLEMADRVVPYDFDISMTYANPASPYCAPPSRFGDYVMDRLNEGALLVNYIGHGAAHKLDYLKWRNQYYNIGKQDEMVAKLDINPRSAPVMLIVACSTGRYDLPEGTACLAEALLFHEGGPIAVISSSRISHPYPNAIFQNAVTREMAVEHRATVGGVDVAATRSFLHLDDEEDQQVESLASVMAVSQGWATSPAALRLLHASLYNLLGDPATAISYAGSDEFADLSYDGGTGKLTGRWLGGVFDDDGERVEIRARIEVPRGVIARGDELQAVVGRDDPDLEAKARKNYEIANDLGLSEVRIAEDVASDGWFEIDLPRLGELKVPREAARLWIKVGVYESSTGVLEGVGSVAVELGSGE